MSFSFKMFKYSQDRYNYILPCQFWNFTQVYCKTSIIRAGINWYTNYFALPIIREFEKFAKNYCNFMQNLRNFAKNYCILAF